MKKYCLAVILFLTIPIFVSADGYMGNISLRILDKTLNCKKVSADVRNSEHYALSDNLVAGEIVRIIEEINEDQYITKQFAEDKYYILDRNDLENNSFTIYYDNSQKELALQLSPLEHLISLNLEISPHDELQYIAKLNRFINKLYDKCESDTLKLLTGHTIKNQQRDLGITSLPKDKLAKILSYDYQKSAQQKSNDEMFPLLLEIVKDGEIPMQIKRRYILNFLYLYNKNSKSNIEVTEFLEIALNVIDEMANFNYSGFNGIEQQDQSALNAVLDKYKRGLINEDEMFSFALSLLEIDKNPAITFQAYAILTQLHLQAGNSDLAWQMVIESFEKYDEPKIWNHFTSRTYLNVKSALVFIDFLMLNESEPEDILTDINRIDNAATNFPEFQNYLLYRKALVAELSSLPQGEVIASYQKINFEPEEIYSYYNDSSGQGFYLRFWYIKDFILKPMQKFQTYKLEIEGEFETRNFLLSEDASALNLPAGTEIEVLQEIPYILHDSKEFKNQNWVKAKIKDEIYWVKLKVDE